MLHLQQHLQLDLQQMNIVIIKITTSPIPTQLLINAVLSIRITHLPAGGVKVGHSILDGVRSVDTDATPVDTDEILLDTDDISVDNGGICVDTNGISVDTCGISVDTGGISVDTSGISVDT